VPCTRGARLVLGNPANDATLRAMNPAPAAARSKVDACAPCAPRTGRVAVALVAGALVAAIALAAMPPAERPTLPADAEARGAAFEQAIVAAVTKVRAGDEGGGARGEAEWAIAIDPADINAWLATRLPKWVAHDDALAPVASASAVRLAAVDGAIAIEDRLGPFVASVRLVPRVEAGRLALDFATPRIGRLPVPGAASGLARAVRSQLEASESHTSVRFRLVDGRTVELREVSCSAGRIALGFATIPAEKRRPSADGADPAR
jgi:hypothetical protein